MFSTLPRPAKPGSTLARSVTLSRGLALALAVGWASHQTAEAQQPAALLEAPAPPRFVRLSAYWENDGAVALKPWHATDRHYTNGFGGAVTWQSDAAAQFLDRFLPASDGAAIGLGFGHEIHTPADLLRFPPNPNDRPYAGYLYGGAFLQRQVNGPHADHYDALRLDLGVVGPSAQAKAIQTGIHDTFTGDDPSGWSAQLGDEFTAQLQYQRKLRFDAGGFELGDTRFDGQLIPVAELNLGTVRRDLGASVVYRLGLNLPDDFGPDQLRDTQSLTADPTAHAAGHPLGDDFNGRRGTWHAYSIARLGGKFVAWNTFLEGNYKRDPSPAVEREPWVGEAELGLAVGYTRGRHAFELNYSTTWLTDEFKSQTGRDSFASLNLRWAWAF